MAKYLRFKFDLCSCFTVFYAIEFHCCLFYKSVLCVLVYSEFVSVPSPHVYWTALLATNTSFAVHFQ